MKSISYIWVLFACLILTSCYEDDTLISEEFGGSGRFEFPQGTDSWDEEIAQIYNDYGVRLIYKGTKDEDFNLSWLGGSTSEGGFGTITYHMRDCINNEMIQFYVTFMKEHIFKLTSPQLRDKVFPMYWYLTFDYHSVYDLSPFYIGYNAYTNQDTFEYMDFWISCFWGQTVGAGADPIESWSSPVSGMKSTYDYQRFTIMRNIMRTAFQRGNIVAPAEFSNGFDFRTAIITGESAENKANSNYYLTRGFAGGANPVGGVITYEKPGSQPIQANVLFHDYIKLAMGFNAAQREEMFPSATYPFVKQKFDFVIQYMKQTYDVDLEAIANGPANWEITPYPELPPAIYPE